MLIKFLNGTEKEFITLQGADLYGADLRGADLYGADLRGADLRGAYLSGADLRGAYLRYADLYGANLRGANLYGANLRYADLYGANLYGANLRCADLYGANLYGANLRGAKGLDAFCILPAGDLIGYKKLTGGAIATLRIPADARRVNAYSSRKCRAEYAIVLDGFGVAQFDETFTYEPGATVRPREPFDDDPRVGCGSGIHFFITRQEAIDY